MRDIDRTSTVTARYVAEIGELYGVFHLVSTDNDASDAGPAAQVLDLCFLPRYIYKPRLEASSSKQSKDVARCAADSPSRAKSSAYID